MNAASVTNAADRGKGCDIGTQFPISHLPIMHFIQILGSYSMCI
jgi:hypothetical protein